MQYSCQWDELTISRFVSPKCNPRELWDFCFHFFSSWNAFEKISDLMKIQLSESNTKEIFIEIINEIQQQYMSEAKNKTIRLVIVGSTVGWAVTLNAFNMFSDVVFLVWSNHHHLSSSLFTNCQRTIVYVCGIRIICICGHTSELVFVQLLFRSESYFLVVA